MVGVEIEFGGLSPDDATEIAVRCLGGSPAKAAAGDWRLDGSTLGRLKIYLDTALRPEGTGFLAETEIAIGRQIVPVEIVTDPVSQECLPDVERLVAALARAGAEGSRAAPLYGFGLHLNVALADPRGGADLPRGALAFALLEPWLRARDPLDPSRRILPFTAPFPPAFADAMAEAGPGLALDALFDLIDAQVRSRNHGLDLLPAYAALAPDRFAGHPAAGGAVSARPAYHVRMPESRLDEPGWSLSYEWRRWWLVERVAADPPLLSRLCALRLRLRERFFAGSALVAETTEALGSLSALAPDGGPQGGQAG